MLILDLRWIAQGIVEGKLIQMKGIVGIWPANSVGDDIHVRQLAVATVSTPVHVLSDD